MIGYWKYPPGSEKPEIICQYSASLSCAGSVSAECKADDVEEIATNATSKVVRIDFIRTLLAVSLPRIARIAPINLRFKLYEDDKSRLDGFLSTLNSTVDRRADARSP